MKNVLFAILVFSSMPAMAEMDLCHVRLDNDQFGHVVFGAIDTDVDHTAVIKQSLFEKKYVIDNESNVTLKFRIRQNEETAKTVATLNWVTQTKNLGEVSLQKIDGKVAGIISLGVAYQSDRVSFKNRQIRAVKKMLENLPSCP